MTGYMIAMLVTGVCVVGAHIYARAFLSAWLLFLSCLPFALVPGLTDPLYIPLPRNSPIVGGALAFTVAFAIFRWGNQAWHFLIAVAFGVMMLWNAGRVMGIPAEVHGIGLEVIFYGIMLWGYTALYVDLEDRLPSPNEFKEVLSQWRVW